MNPWLLHTDAVRVPTYFTLLMVGFALATAVLRREALRGGLPPRQVMNAAIVALPLALFGARAAHVLIVAPRLYWDNPLFAIRPTGGWVFFGGALGGVIAVTGWARFKELDPWAVLDVFAPATAFGLMFGRLGCLGAGCCYGRPADWPFGIAVPWSIRYYGHGQLPPELLGVPLHPAPLYAAGLALGLFLVLSVLRARQRFSGQTVLAFLVLYGIGRSVVELFRADASRGMWLGGWLSTSQIIGLVAAAIAVVLWLVRARTVSDRAAPG